MNTYHWGVDLTRKFYPHVNDRPFQIPTQTPAIYVFLTMPTRDAAAAGTGAVQTITSWTQDAIEPFACSYTIAAIDDPEPTGGSYARTYYEAINYRLQTSEQVQTIIRSFDIERARAAAALPGASKEDCKRLYPALVKYVSDTELDDFIGAAQEEVRLSLYAKGFQWPAILQLEQLALPVAYKAISLASFSQMKEPGDRFDKRYEEFKAKCAELMNGIQLPVDKDGDGLPEEVAKPRNEWLVIR